MTAHASSRAQSLPSRQLSADSSPTVDSLLLPPCLSTATSAIAVDRPSCSAAATRRHRAESRSVCVAVVVRGAAELAVGLSQGGAEP